MRIVQSLNFRWWNASAEYALSLSEDLSRLGHEVIVLARNGSPASDRARESGLRTLTPRWLGSKNPALSMSAVAGMLGLFLREKIQVADLNDGESHFAGSIASILLGRRVKVVRTMSEARGSKPNILNYCLYKYATDAVVTTNGWTADVLARQFDLDETKVFSIIPGIDTQMFSPGVLRGALRSRLGAGPETLIVGTIGRLSPVKGQYYLLKAASLLNSFPEAAYVISGRDEEINREDLKETAEALEVAARFSFLDEVSDVRAIIDDLDIAVVPSVGSEEISRIVVELMSMGKPVIASAVGSIPELIEDGVTGYLVPPGDADALAAKLSLLLSSRGKRISLGSAAREEAVRRFDRSAAAGKLDRIFRDLAGEMRNG